MSTEERTRTDEPGTESSIAPDQTFDGADATRVLKRAATDELTGRKLNAILLPSAELSATEPTPFAGVITGRDDDGRIRIRIGGPVRFADPDHLMDVRLGPQIDRGDGPIPDGGETDRCRTCDRCQRDIHDLEPAAVLSFSAAIETDDLTVCVDCGNLLIEWWNERPVDQDVDRGDGVATDGGSVGDGVERTPDEIQAKIEELRAFNDYPFGPDGKNLRYKHQGWVDALLWVLGSGMGVQP